MGPTNSRAKGCVVVVVLILSFFYFSFITLISLSPFIHFFSLVLFSSFLCPPLILLFIY